MTFPSKLSYEELLVMANQAKSGVDVHAQTAKRYGMSRQDAKKLNYMWMYSMKGGTL